jgi:DNA-binding XRE family transcriptional regulator
MSSRRTQNNVRRIREEQLLTKAELARKAGVSPLTVTRVENGLECRVDTKRKIILALGMQPADRAKVFGSAKAARRGRA